MEKKINIKELINELEENRGRILFNIFDTEGVVMDSVLTIFNYVRLLNEKGFNAYVIKSFDLENNYDWISEELKNVPIIDIKTEELKIKATDILVVPDIFVDIMKSVENYPCRKVVLFQNYEYAIEALEPGMRWSDFNFKEVIVTNRHMARLAEEYFKYMTIYTINIPISKEIKPLNSLRKPMFLIYSRISEETTRFIKAFYLKNPHLNWIGFKVVSNLSKNELNTSLNDSMALIWLDRSSSYGMLPIEAMTTNTPIIGYVPMLEQDYIELDVANNNIWGYNIFDLVHYSTQFAMAWLDNLNVRELVTNDIDILKKHNDENVKDELSETFQDIISKQIEFFKKVDNEK